jgi:hypothetical protein
MLWENYKSNISLTIFGLLFKLIKCRATLFNLRNWIELSVYYDLSSVQIHEALYKFFKSHWFHYEIDCIDIDKFLNNEQNSDTVWLHVFKRIHRNNSPFWIKFILQNVLNWFFACKIQFFGIHFDIARNRSFK